MVFLWFSYGFPMVFLWFSQTHPPAPEHQLGLPAPATKALEEAAAEEPGGHQEPPQPGLQRSGWQ